jgi:phosphoribosylglycinamide formyltransferase 1
MKQNTRKNLAILISGRGSNMAALVKAAETPDFPGRVVLVLSNDPRAEGLAFAAGKAIPTIGIDHRQYHGDRQAFDSAVDLELARAGVDLICLAGFMRILSAGFVTKWQGRMINIHPSLLPAYPGLHTHERALAAGDKQHGCTVHFVTEGVDAGPVIAQAKIDILPGDTPASLAARVLAEEHKLYPAALRQVLDGKVTFTPA